jgi:hypothetical protein
MPRRHPPAVIERLLIEVALRRDVSICPAEPTDRGKGSAGLLDGCMSLAHSAPWGEVAKGPICAAWSVNDTAPVGIDGGR